MLNVIYFIVIVIVVLVLIYVLLQALEFLKIGIPPAIRNILAALLFMILLYVFLRYFNLLPPGLASIPQILAI